MLEQLEALLNERVRPYLHNHGGDVEILSYEDGIFKIRMLGQCAGCPAADLTNETIIESELKSAFPELKQVALVYQVSEDLLNEAKRLMTRSKEH